MVQQYCKGQDRIATSSAEAELKSACKGVSELLGMRNLRNFLTPSVCTRLVHELDAEAAQGIMQRQGAGALKHLDLRQLWVQECVLEENIQIKHIQRTVNWSDALCSVPTASTWWTQMGNLGMIFPHAGSTGG